MHTSLCQFVAIFVFPAQLIVYLYDACIGITIKVFRSGDTTSGGVSIFKNFRKGIPQFRKMNLSFCLTLCRFRITTFCLEKVFNSGLRLFECLGATSFDDSQFKIIFFTFCRDSRIPNALTSASSFFLYTSIHLLLRSNPGSRVILSQHQV